jgi:uncharacterized protein YjbI with pentapeptide repeats
MANPPTYGPYHAKNANLAGSSFNGVNLTGTDFNDVSLNRARFHNVDLRDATLSAAQIGGAVFRHIGPPPGTNETEARPRPVTFDRAMLCDSRFLECDLSGVAIERCDIAGMTIEGIPVADLLAAYRKA